MDEIGKYRKRKFRGSKAEKRADHKHQYERTISVHVNPIDGEIDGFYWTTHCSICGRLGDYETDNDDFRNPEYIGRRLWWCREMFLSMEEIKKKFPDIPMYRRDPDDWHKEVRLE